MNQIFVTGATGVLGRRTIPLLVNAGYGVTAVARSEDKAHRLREDGAKPVAVDLFDPQAVDTAVAGHDAVVHLATNIPTGGSMVTKRGWATNDRLRSEASANLAAAVRRQGIERYVQESITFPYVDGGDDWVDEQTERRYYWGDRSTVDAEAAAASVTASGGNGVVLRFAMFAAADSAHLRTCASMARTGIWSMFGDDDAYFSLIDADDAASSVVASLEAPAGVYNVAEAEPLRRREHRAALAAAAGRARLRALPLVERVSGAASDSLARSHRISSANLQTVTDWRPTSAGIDVWGRLS